MALRRGSFRILFLAMACALLLPALAPPPAPAAAGTCAWLPPAPGRFVHWVGNETLLTNDADSFVLLFVPDGDVEPMFNRSTLHSPRTLAAVSGDLQWMAYAHGSTSCDDAPGRVDFYSLRTGEQVPVFEGGAEAMAASQDLLAVAHQGKVTMVPWGDVASSWELVVDNATGFDPAHVRSLAFSPDGSLLAAHQGDGAGPLLVHVFDVATGDFFDPEEPALRVGDEQPLVRFAWSPEGQRMAVSASGGLGPPGEGVLAVSQLIPPPFQRLEDRLDPGARTALTWGPAGIVTASVVTQQRPEGLVWSTVLRRFDAPVDHPPDDEVELGDTAIGALAWNANGTLLAAGGSGKVFLFDPEMRLVATHSLGPSNEPRPGASPPEVDMPPDQEPAPSEPAADGDNLTGPASRDPEEPDVIGLTEQPPAGGSASTPGVPASLVLLLLAGAALAARRP